MPNNTYKESLTSKPITWPTTTVGWFDEFAAATLIKPEKTPVKKKKAKQIFCIHCHTKFKKGAKKYKHSNENLPQEYMCSSCWDKASKCSHCLCKTHPMFLYSQSVLSKYTYPDKLAKDYKQLCTSCYDSLKKQYLKMYWYMCYDCGKKFHNDSSYPGLNKWCDSCKPKHQVCEHCHKTANADKKILTKDGKVEWWCHTCYVENQPKLQHCMICGYPVKNQSISVISSQHTICKACGDKHPHHTVCKWCGSKNGDYAVRGSKGYCRSCYNSPSTRFCESCGEDRNAVVEYHCQVCHSQNDGYLSEAHWKYSPSKLWIHGENKDNLYFGVENEVKIDVNHTNKGTVLANIMSRSDHKRFYAKYDGSIGGIEYGEEGHGIHGFELVTYPHTFEAMKEYDWSVMFHHEGMKDPTCGMHIHMTKIAFTTLHLFKFLKFITHKPNFITKIAERPLNKYSKALTKSQLAGDAKKKFKEKCDENRKVAVNITNPDTVELRFFANVDSVDGMFKNLEFAHSLFYFTKHISLKQSCDVATYTRYVSDNQKKYPNLAKFLGVYTTRPARRDTICV